MRSWKRNSQSGCCCCSARMSSFRAFITCRAERPIDRVERHVCNENAVCSISAPHCSVSIQHRSSASGGFLTSAFRVYVLCCRTRRAAQYTPWEILGNFEEQRVRLGTTASGLDASILGECSPGSFRRRFSWERDAFPTFPTNSLKPLRNTWGADELASLISEVTNWTRPNSINMAM